MDFIPKNIDKYSKEHTENESLILSKLNRETWKNTMQPRMLSGHFQGRVLATFSKMIKPLNIIEVGTFTGYSALCMAEGLRDKGMVHTIDINEENCSIAKKYFNQSIYKDNIKQYIGNAINIIPNLDITFQMAFIDADKENYYNYFDLIINKIDIGGYIIADNVLWSGKVLEEDKDKDTLALDNYNKKIINDNRVETLLLPIRDGLMITRRIK